MLEELKKEVYEANMLLPHYGLVTFTWGNVSGIDREKGLFVIKPSGVDYEKLTPEDMVVVDLNGNKIEGDLNPSSDTATHVVLYNRFPKIGGVVHTHSPWATSWAQAGRGIPCYGTTHADYLYGEVPCVRNLTKEEIDEAYEKNTGVLIADEFAIQNLDYIATPAVLCKNHGPFTWGKDAHEAVHNAVVLEEVAKMAARAELVVDQQAVCLVVSHLHQLLVHRETLRDLVHVGIANSLVRRAFAHAAHMRLAVVSEPALPATRLHDDVRVGEVRAVATAALVLGVLLGEPPCVVERDGRRVEHGLELHAP